MSVTESTKYNGQLPCCGIYCGTCPKFMRDNNGCLGAEGHCEVRRCVIYKCCAEKKGLPFCSECKTFPCSRFRKFADTWLKLGQNLIENLEYIKEHGSEKFIEKFNNR